MIANPYRNPRSFSYQARKRRFVHVQRIIEEILATQETCSIIDIGGREVYWDVGRDFLDAMGERVKISLVNIEEIEVENTVRFSARAGDGCDLKDISDNQFDFAHSNSTIEHVGSWENMNRFAREFVRVARRQYIQTPYMWFPIEPHFRAIGFQWLPESTRAKILLRRGLGFLERQPNLQAAMDLVQHICLLDRGQMKALLPECTHVDERVGFMTKSLLAYK